MSTYPDLHNKVYIVTGGGSGMGRATCKALAAEGARVVLGNRNPVEGEATAAEIRAAGGQAVFRQTDVSRAADCAALVACALEHFGRLDGAFNNAGLQREFCDIHETPDADISDVIDINLKGMLYMMKYEAEAMLVSGGGSIVNVGSILSLTADPFLTSYTATKHGVLGLTRALAVDYASAGIRANCVLPGDMETPMILEYFAASDDPEATRKEMEDAYPIKRIARPREVAQAVLFLASDESSFVSGAELLVDGALTVKAY